MIHVSAEPDRKLVRARMGGMLTLEEVQDFSRQEQDLVRRMGLGNYEFDLLVETEGNLVQTAEVMAAFQALMFDTPIKARRIAVIRDGVLTRMQTRRVARVREGAEVFDNLAEAEEWLAS